MVFQNKLCTDADLDIHMFNTKIKKAVCLSSSSPKMCADYRLLTTSYKVIDMHLLDYYRSTDPGKLQAVLGNKLARHSCR